MGQQCLEQICCSSSVTGRDCHGCKGEDGAGGLGGRAQTRMLKNRSKRIVERHCWSCQGGRKHLVKEKGGVVKHSGGSRRSNGRVRGDYDKKGRQWCRLKAPFLERNAAVLCKESGRYCRRLRRGTWSAPGPQGCRALEAELASFGEACRGSTSRGGVGAVSEREGN